MSQPKCDVCGGVGVCTCLNDWRPWILGVMIAATLIIALVVV